MFADDTNLFFSESSYEKVFQVANEELKSIDNTGQHTNFCRRYFNGLKVYQVR